MPFQSQSGYLDKLSRIILSLYKNHPFTRYSVHDLAVKLDTPSEQLSSQVVYLMKDDCLKISPSFAMTHKAEMESLNGCIDSDTPLELTTKGRLVLEEAMHHDKYFYFNEIRAWTTLAIAVIGLILSIIALQ